MPSPSGAGRRRVWRRVGLIVGAVAVVGGAATSIALAARPQPRITPILEVTVPVSSGTVATTASIQLNVKHAHLESVTVRTAAGALVGGSVVGGQWKPTAPMAWATTFHMTVRAKGGRPVRTLARAVSWTTPEEPLPSGSVGITVSPSPGQQVGMGATWVVQFSQPIPAALQPSVLQRLSASESLADPLGWHWWSPTEVDGRPEQFWPLNEQAGLSVNLNGLVLNGHRLVSSSASSSFTVVNQHLTRISAITDQMQVYDGTQLVRTEPVSLGRAGFLTISGTLVVLSKTPVVFMNSATIGYPGLYAENVYEDVAISTDGYYIHSANWDIYDHGRYNVSHGCVEQNPNDATWFYNYSLPGDVVIITGTTLQASEADGEGDWNIPWSAYQPA